MAKAATKPVPRMVESLKTFRDQVNKLAPKRSKASDGWIGDVKHQARHSDHNPEPDGTVDAFDLTNDPTNGVDTQKVADALVSSKDKRISYIICNGRIVSGRKGPKPWTWRKYTGANGHYHHMHLSVLDDDQDDTTPWKIESAFKTKPNEKLTTEQVSSVMHLGSTGEFVEELQKNLNQLGYGPLKVDGHFGEKTEASVIRFQRDNGLLDDGWAGPRTLELVGVKLAQQNLTPKVAAAEKKADEAEKKVGAAKEVVDEAAGDGKVTTTEWLSGVVGVSGTLSIVKQAVDSVTGAAESFGSLLATLGPWLLLTVVVAGGAAYIIYDRRKQRLKAQAIKQVL